MKTADQTAREWLDEPAGFKGIRHSLANVILADRRAVVDELTDWLEHGLLCPQNPRCSGHADYGEPCECGLDAALDEILETKGTKDG